jgi:hypothetical protein
LHVAALPSPHSTHANNQPRFFPPPLLRNSSERLSRSGAQGERMKEAQAINSSLSALGDVIMARAHKAKQ